jgi:hypothetical protein
VDCVPSRKASIIPVAVSFFAIALGQLVSFLRIKNRPNMSDQA